VLRAVRAAEAGLTRGYAQGDGCLMQFLQQALDDPDPQPCGRCSVCTGNLPAPGARASGTASRQHAGSVVKTWWWSPARCGRRACPTVRARSASWRRDAPALAFADDPAWDEELAALGQRDGNRFAIDRLVDAVNAALPAPRSYPVVHADTDTLLAVAARPCG
jgi:ATP-dependent DNA helicase RecQ